MDSLSLNVPIAAMHSKRNYARVTIGMPVHNDEKYVGEALDSLLAQTYLGFEIIISDNASTDKTSEICHYYERRDPRVHYIRQPQNCGPNANFNYLLSIARGEFFMWSASDDRWSPNFVGVLVELLERNPHAVIAFGAYTFIDTSGNRFDGVKCLQYGSTSASGRIYKFCRRYDDACFYGLYRRSALTCVRFPIWWRPNSSTPLNGAYPVICEILAAGDYCYAGELVVWENRIHPLAAARIGYVLYVPRLLYLPCMFLRKFNVFCYSVRGVHRGTRSIVTTIATIPFLFVRFYYDCLVGTCKYVKSITTKLLRLLFRKGA